MSLTSKLKSAATSALDKATGADTPPGKHSNNYTYLDVDKQGLRRTDGRLRDVYDESNQVAYNDPMTDKPSSSWWVMSIAAAVGTWILLLGMVPHLAHLFPFNLIWFLQYKLTLGNIFKILVIGVAVGGATMGVMYLNRQDNQTGKREARKLLANDYNDAHVALPEELAYKYDIVPDNKVHFDLDVTSLLSHLMIRNTAGVHGKDGRVKFDNDFSQELFDVAKLPHDGKSRKLYDAAKLPYNPNNAYGKNPGKTVKDAINNSWHVPDYEDPNSQDPSGMYIVSTRPENTILISETRGGKGQK